MSKSFIPTPKINAGLPQGTKIPLAAYMQQLNPSGMTPAQLKQAALAVQTGNGGLPVGSGRSNR